MSTVQLLRSICHGLIVVWCPLACDDGYLRGSVATSADGKTYLEVLDDNGGQCGPLIVDGKPWPHAIGVAGPIQPGTHRIECGGEIEFTVPSGTVFSFDYWGP